MALNPPNLTTINGKGFWIQSLGSWGLENSYVPGTQKQVAAIAGGLETAWVQNGYLSLQTMLNGVLTERVHISSAGVTNIVGSLTVNGSVVGAGGTQWVTSGSNIYYSVGNVGIGTSSPVNSLTISASVATGTFGNILIQDLGHTSAVGVNSYITGCDSAGSINWSVGSSAGIVSLVNDSATFPVTFWTNGAERMRINASGQVGIGTASPTSKLQVAGLPTYASDSAAGTGGLTSGAFYIDASGGLHAKL